MDFLVWFHTIQIAGILLASFYILCKSTGGTASLGHKALVVGWSLLWAFFYGFKPAWLPLPLFLIVLCVVSILLIWRVGKVKIDKAASAYLLALGISYCLFYAVFLPLTLLYGLALGAGHTNGYVVTYENPLYFPLYALVFALQLLASWALFRIRRFKNGFSFLLQRYAIVVMLPITGGLLALVTLLTNPGNIYYNYYYVLGILIVGAGIVIGIRRGIKAAYKRNMLARDIDLLEKELAEKNAEIERLRAQNEVVRTANHKINRRLSAMERGVAALAANARNGMSAELGEEFAGTLDAIRSLTQEYQDEVARLGERKLLPTTKIKSIDNLFEYYQAQCMENKIDFNLKVTGSILFLTERVIPRNILETMIGDHLQDALIAVNSGENPFRGILAVLGLAGDCYELSIFDSGVVFKIDTLLRLGTERVTTHEATGSSGIGFMTTFESVKQYGVSLIIEEKRPAPSDYSKSVTLRFDGKGEYIVRTYRPEQFPSTSGPPRVVGTCVESAMESSPPRLAVAQFC